MNRVSLLLIGMMALGTTVSLGCEKSCGFVDFVPSEARLTLHLPPESDVTTPETLTVCRESECATGTLPPAPVPTSVAHVATSNPEVTAEMSLGTAEIRVLAISWILQPGDLHPANPHHAFTAAVTDAAGAKTGALSGEVTYAHSHDPCGGDVWIGQLSD